MNLRKHIEENFSLNRFPEEPCARIRVTRAKRPRTGLREQVPTDFTLNKMVEQTIDRYHRSEKIAL